MLGGREGLKLSGGIGEGHGSNVSWSACGNACRGVWVPWSMGAHGLAVHGENMLLPAVLPPLLASGLCVAWNPSQKLAWELTYGRQGLSKREETL